MPRLHHLDVGETRPRHLGCHPDLGPRPRLHHLDVGETRPRYLGCHPDVGETRPQQPRLRRRRV
ncbi:MAG: hypothetical protein ACRD0P_08715 [Stackebrandtia sp.]